MKSGCVSRLVSRANVGTFRCFLRVSQKGCVLSARQWRGNSFLVSQVVLVSIGLLSEVQLLGDRAEVGHVREVAGRYISLLKRTRHKHRIGEGSVWCVRTKNTTKPASRYGIIEQKHRGQSYKSVSGGCVRLGCGVGWAVGGSPGVYEEIRWVGLDDRP